MSNNEEGLFDVVILGTGLTESIIAAALSKANYKVAHIDKNQYYGDNEATLSQDELLSWGEAVNQGRHPKFSGFTGTSVTLPYSRQYSICLRPAILPALGPLISSLIGSGVAKYSGFRLLDSVSIYSPDGTVKSVPGSKEDIFNNKDISLIEKRRLMRFLTFAAGEFEEKPELQDKEEAPFIDFLKSTFTLSDSIASVIAYSLAHCSTPNEPTLQSLLRLRSYLRSIGRYGPSPFLIGHYGGIGDISQGFCRAAAVSGGVYVLGRPVLASNFTTSTDKYPITFTLDDFPEPLHCKLVVSLDENSPPGLEVPVLRVKSSNQPPSPIVQVARGIVIIDKPLRFRHLQTELSRFSAEGEAATPSQDSPPTSIPPVDAALLVFPPTSIPGGSTTHTAIAHITGEASLSTPKGKWIVYFLLPLDSLTSDSAESHIRPYVDALLSLPSNRHDAAIEPLSYAFFFENVEHHRPSKESEASQTELARHLIVPPLNYSTFPDFPDNATRDAEAVFRTAMRSLRSLEDNGEVTEDIEFWPPIEPNDEYSDDDS
ncbi:rab escort protein [Coprinopsis cinerea AmutBmut pab1-1]|nr:rab escort protein [Coprinopsis cinerea AmutBmut pab1-1]